MIILKYLLAAIVLFTFFKGDCQSQGSANSHFEKGVSFSQKKEVQKAYDSFLKSYNQSLSERNLDLLVKSLNEIGKMNYSLSEDQQSVLFRQSKAAFQLLKDYPENSDLALLHQYTGEFYFNFTYNADSIIYHFKESMRISIQLNGEWHEAVAICYHGMGDAYKFLSNDFLEAEKCYEKALRIRKQIKSKNEIQWIRLYYGLAATNRSQRDFEKALSYGTQTLEWAIKAKHNVYQEMTCYILANIYRDMSKSQEAKEYYLKAIELNKLRSEPQELGFYYMGLGETLRNDSLPDEALKYFTKALQYSKTDKLQIVYLLNQMAETYLMKMDFIRSRKTFKDQFEELAALGMLNSKHAYYGYIGIGDCLFKMNHYDSAIHYYQRALGAALKNFKPNKSENPTESVIGTSYYIHGALERKAQALSRLYGTTQNADYLHGSLKTLSLAEKLLSQERNTLDMEDSKWGFLQSNYNIYEEIIGGSYQLANGNAADSLLGFVFKYFEQSKSRSLSEALIRDEQANEISSNDSLLRMHQLLNRELFSVQDKLNKEIEKNSENTERAKELRAEIVRLDGRFQEIKIRIEERFPGYFKIKYLNFVPQLKEFQQLIASENQVVLNYFFGNNSVYALGISGDRVLFKRLGDADNIRVTVNALISHFSIESSSTDLNVYKAFVSNSHSLYNVLIDPFKELLREDTRLQIIPDGLISQVPFEVLIEKKHSGGQVNYRSLSYLIRKYPIGYAYSSALLLHHSSEARRKPSLLAMGFTNGSRLRAPEPQFEELAGTEKELDALSNRFNSGKFLEGKEATEHNFKLYSPEFDIIHLAIHGRGDIDKKYSASLYFRSKSDSVDDGELHAYELYGLKLKAELTVLSACESGLGKDYRGEGMGSMASAFTYAGCENILMSLWKVNDQASIDLMDDFYARMVGGDRIDDALAAAKLKYLENADELTSDPRVWAPLVAYGKLNQVFVGESRSRIYLFTGLAILTLLLLFLLVKKGKNFIG